MKSFAFGPFYGMVDSAARQPPVELARLLLEGGARVIQLRLKEASARDQFVAAVAIAELCHKSGALLLVNDRPDIALLAGADGVHLGQEDVPLRAARRLLGTRAIIGVSTHNLEQAVKAESEGADYIGFGPMYPGGLKRTVTPVGLESLRDVRAAVKLPIVAIGAIRQANVREVLNAGANSVAIISDVIQAENIPAKVRAVIAAAERRS
jgi:thiamine-phosphate pyrophosphorylase